MMPVKVLTVFRMIVGAGTTTQDDVMVLIDAPARPEILALLLVKAAGLVAQLALLWPGAFVTFTRTVHEPLAGTLTPLTVMLLPPAAAVVAATALLHVPAMPGVAATRRPEGRLSVKLIASANGIGLVTVKVSTVVPPDAMVVGENDLIRSGQDNVTDPFGVVNGELTTGAV